MNLIFFEKRFCDDVWGKYIEPKHMKAKVMEVLIFLAKLVLSEHLKPPKFGYQFKYSLYYSLWIPFS